MDFQPHCTSLLEHYKKLHANPGWRQYVEQRVAELAKLEPSLYGHFPEQFKPAQPVKSSAARRSSGK